MENKVARITITFETRNAAFDEDPEFEAARILEEIAYKFKNGENYTSIRDINGNKIGTVTLLGEQDEDAKQLIQDVVNDLEDTLDPQLDEADWRLVEQLKQALKQL